MAGRVVCCACLRDTYVIYIYTHILYTYIQALPKRYQQAQPPIHKHNSMAKAATSNWREGLTVMCASFPSQRRSPSSAPCPGVPNTKKAASPLNSERKCLPSVITLDPVFAFCRSGRMGQRRRNPTPTVHLLLGLFISRHPMKCKLEIIVYMYPLPPYSNSSGLRTFHTPIQRSLESKYSASILSLHPWVHHAQTRQAHKLWGLPVQTTLYRKFQKGDKGFGLLLFETPSPDMLISTSDKAPQSVYK